MNNPKTSQGGARRFIRPIGFLLLALLVVAGFMYGPDLLDYAGFVDEANTIAQQNAITGGAWPQVHDECVLCHGFNGNTVTEIYPRLAGQPAAYIAQQLTAFAAGTRNNPAMEPLAKTMSDSEIKELANYFAKQRPKRNLAFHADPARAAQGEIKAKAVCAACHGARLAGHDAFPRLAGQGHDYLVKQLLAFKNGDRHDANGVMAAIATTLSPDDIENLANYLASH